MVAFMPLPNNELGLLSVSAHDGVHRGAYPAGRAFASMDGEITPAELDDLLAGDADVRVVDIRSPRAYVQGHIPGSENVPFHRLTTDVERFAGAERVVTVCPHGQSSVQAANLIASYEGVDVDATVESMAGGLTAWEGDLAYGDDAEDDDEGPNFSDASDEGPDAPF